VTEFVTKLDLAEQLLIRSIASGEIGPGEPLRQVELAERLGVSPTPVREALRRLEAQGLVVRQAHRGVRVAEVEPAEMAELYIIRGALEGLAVEHATPNLTKKDLAALEQIHQKLEAGRAEGALKSLRKLNYDFHTRLYRRSKLPRLVRIIDSLWPLFPWDSIWAVPGRADSSAAEHALILEALRAGDAVAAGQRMKQHIEHGGQTLVAFREAAAAGPDPRTRRRGPSKDRNGTGRPPASGKRQSSRQDSG
jgi:DNA-binding GntR family transcriptional regulator